MDDATKAVAESKARITELEATVATMVSKRMGRDTTPEDVFAAYPHIEKEIEEEIENHQWHKDVN